MFVRNRAILTRGAALVRTNTASRTASVDVPRILVTASRSLSSSTLVHWSDIPMGPPDPIIGLSEAFVKDDFAQKVNVGVGAYRGDDGKPHILPCVREAEQIIQTQGLDHEYAGMVGEKAFVDLALKFVYGDDSVPLQEGRVAGVQSLSGTGGLRIFGEFLARFGHKKIYVPNPTWGNHKAIFTNAGLEVKQYRYYDSASSDLDFDGLMEDLANIDEGTVVLLHACAHNPTGMDPTPEQWNDISAIMSKRKLFPFFDCAYQGFASGNAPEDAAAIRAFVADGGHRNLAVVQSFSKNFGLYGQRVGALSIVGSSPDEAANLLSQLKITIRPSYSNPPRHGARIVSTILGDDRLKGEFIDQCRDMAERINRMRISLRGNLEDELGSTHSWKHITKQIGMFAYSGLSQDQVVSLRDKHHIYCTLDGRISMAGVTSGNVDYIAGAIHDVTK